MEIRLQKVIAQAGLASRRAAETMIRQGRVSVNGKVVVEMGVRVDPDVDEILVDGKPVKPATESVTLIFNKPRGCVTTMSDPEGRETVARYLPSSAPRVFPVGRLDYDAEGLLLLTNDGNLAHRLQHPRFGVPKRYLVKVKGHPDAGALEELRSGVVLEEGKTAPAKVDTLRVLPNATWLEIVLHQGWNRQIKRMGAKVGHPVIKIKRVEYGPLGLGKLRPGESRNLTNIELRRLREAAGINSR